MLLLSLAGNSCIFTYTNARIIHITKTAITEIYHYENKANRELKNTVERAVYRAVDTVVDTIVFDPFTPPYTTRPQAAPGDAGQEGPEAESVHSLVKARERLERSMLADALKATRYNQRKAAMRLGLTYDQLRGLYRKYKDQLSS